MWFHRCAWLLLFSDHNITYRLVIYIIHYFSIVFFKTSLQTKIVLHYMLYCYIVFIIFLLYCDWKTISTTPTKPHLSFVTVCQEFSCILSKELFIPSANLVICVPQPNNCTTLRSQNNIFLCNQIEAKINYIEWIEGGTFWPPFDYKERCYFFITKFLVFGEHSCIQNFVVYVTH